ncbi:MAG TPA: hypothetical protein VFF50_04595, partial [Candidatus Deferrimicrobiaceae bacterium]|nr:hypothetical protein [Candidatus Deferrimicrobiaceae bacterium]
VEPLTGTHTAFSAREKSAIQEQMERLLTSPYFSHSRRFPSFLRYVIEKTLAGHEDALKERTLGVEIFGRQADYDTAADPIVRVTAGEIRKRIAQYYQTPGHELELRISLQAGGYIPQFHEPASAKDEGSTLTTQRSIAAPLNLSESVKHTPSHHHFWRGFAVSFIFLAMLAAGFVWYWQVRHSPFDFFWGPVVNSSDPVLFCIADQKQYSNIALLDASDQSRQVILHDSLTAVVIDDLSPIVRIAGLLQANDKKYSLRGESDTNLMDLRAGPNIFIGAFDNAWTLRLTRPLRYHFFNNADMTELGVVDSNSPSSARWTVYRLQQMATNNYRDFAIIARFTDSVTGKIAVVAAGVGRGGTIAAGEFLADPANLAMLMHAAKAAGNKKNMEIVLSTQIIGGEPGTPKMEASYFW